MPSGIVNYFTVVEVVAGFLTRNLDNCITIARHSDLRKTSNILHYPFLHTDVLEGLSIIVCYIEIVLDAQNWSACQFNTRPTKPEGANASLPGDTVAWCVLHKVAIFIGDGSWAGSTPKYPVAAWRHLLALQLKISLTGL